MGSDPEPEALAHRLLDEAAAEEDRPQRHLLVAAALHAVLGREPIVVGGAAEDYYVADAYIETDLDLCGWVALDEGKLLRELGFIRRGRHWFHEPTAVAAEFPESKIDGDEGRILRIEIEGGVVAIIGVDDLYLDRVRQSTAEDVPAQQHSAALAIAGANLEVMDWPYVEGVLSRTRKDDPRLGKAMSQIHRRIRRQLSRAIDAGEL